MGGQTDRFGQPIPASPGYQTILNPDGSQPQMRNILRLGAGITASDDPNSEATRFDIDVNVGGSVQMVDAVSNLRNDLFILGPSVDKIFVTKNYKVSVLPDTTLDTGGMQYRWNVTDVTTDDGVLHIKNAFHSTGRFQPIKPSDGMINAQACGPALADIGSINRSFDPTGTVSIGTELKRISSILRNGGWNGILVGRDNLGNGDYKISGSEEIGTSSAPFRPFILRGTDGVRFFGDPVGMTVSRPIGVYTYGNGVPILANGAYTSRFWNQPGGTFIQGGENTFAAVQDISGLSIGDPIILRIGAETTDFSGLCASYFFTTIKSITPGTGITGTIVTWEVCPEPTGSSNGINEFRTQTKHDMIKISGFQDETSIEGITFSNVFIALQYYRNCKVDCTWEECNGFALNGVGGIGLNVPRMLVRKAYGSAPVPGAIITLASQYDTHIGQLIVNDIVPLDTALFQVLTEESSCRGTTIGSADITYNATNGFGAAVSFCGQTPGQTDQITVDHLTVRGGNGQLIINQNAYVGVLDDKSSSQGNFNNIIFVRPDQVGSIVYKGQLYRKKRDYDYLMAIPTSATATDLPTVQHGLTIGLRVKISTMTGVSNVIITGSNFVSTVDVTADMVAGKWVDVNEACVMGIGQNNSVGYNALTIRIQTSGGSPAGAYMLVKHSCFENDLLFSGATDDTSSFGYVVSNGAPTVNAVFVGQECFDSTNSNWYKSVAIGTGASDWKKLTP